MISKRYYLTVLSLVPMVGAQIYLLRRMLRSALTGRERRVWRNIFAVVGVLFVLDVVSVFIGILPRLVTAALQTAVNLYGLICISAVAILLVVEVAAKFPPIRHREDRRRVLAVVARAGIVAPAAAAGFGVFIERTDFEVSETQIAIDRLPAELDGIRLVQISDVHLGPYLSTRTFASVIDAANELKPHLAFITGDLISSKGDPLEDCLNEIARLKADAGLFGCLGNHEVYADAVEPTVDGGARRGVEFLRSHAVKVRVRGAQINVAGVDYEPFDQAPNYLATAASLVEKGMPNILLSHNPDVFPAAAKYGFDLTLAGHMHGGQITCEFVNPALNPARIMTRFVRGLYREGRRSCYVTRGIGTLGLPVRLGSRPEITSITLRRA